MTSIMNRYHYTECGLDDVYLENGFQLSEDGTYVAIPDIEGLHDAIGSFLITHKKNLTGKEIRFLRHEMSMSQATLAKLLDVAEQTIHRWESGKTLDVPKSAEALIRLLYCEQRKCESGIKESLNRIAELEDEIDELLILRETKQGWKGSEKKAA